MGTEWRECYPFVDESLLSQVYFVCFLAVVFTSLPLAWYRER